MRDTSKEKVRAEMAQRIDELLPNVPGERVKSKIPFLARAIGLPAGRLDKYRLGNVLRPAADEYLAVMEYSRQAAAGRARLVDIGKKIEGTLHAYDVKRARVSARADVCGDFGSARDPHLGDAGICEPVLGGSGVLDLSGGLTRFSARVIGVEEIALTAASVKHQKLANVIGETGGEFTEGVAHEIERLGLTGLSWLYRAEPALPVLFIGEDVSILSAAERERALSRPIADEPIAPNLLRVVLGRLGGVLQRNGDPLVHRITAAFGVNTVTWDCLDHHWSESGVVSSSCVMVAA